MPRLILPVSRHYGGRFLAAAVVAFSLVQTHASLASETGTLHRVTIERFKFVPEKLEIKVGDIVEWVNQDAAPHTATAEDKNWTTKGLKKSQSGQVTFNSVGTKAYICRYHPNMRAQIIVTDN